MSTIETVDDYDDGFKMGYEKGARDAWNEINYTVCDGCLENKCGFENCPTMQKLLKAV